MFTFKTTLAVLFLSLVLASINIRRAGWLDRVVQYQKKRFIEDLMKTPPPQITVRIEKPPPGYTDSKDWDYESVIRLLTLIRDSEGAAPVRRAFRRALQTRRYIMPFAETFKAFPSLSKNHPNDFFYDIDSSEYYGDVVVPVQPAKYSISDDDIIVVSNPVEAKLPSAKISVLLLKNIMENRANAGRVMPTLEVPISWPVTEKRTTTARDSAKTDTSTNPVTVADANVTSSEVPQTNVTTGTGNITTTNSTSNATATKGPNS